MRTGPQSMGLFGPTLLVVLNKGAKKAARLWKQGKLQSAMAMLAALTLLSLLVRGGVEQNPGPEFDQASHGQAALTLLSLLVRGGVEQNPGPEFDQASHGQAVQSD